MRFSALAPSVVGALLAGACLTLGTAAYADDEGAEDIGSESAADKSKPAEGSEGGQVEAPKEDDPMANWGVGGKDDDGQFKPKGKTGKLKQLEADAEHERVVEATPAKLGRPGNVWVDTSIAPSGSIIVPIQDGGPTKVAPGASFVIGGSYRIKDKWEVGGRFAVSSSATDGPRTPLLAGSRDPDAFKQIATGNLELSLRPFFKLSQTTVLPVGLALVLPTAQGDMFANPDARVQLARWNVNQSASAMRGWEEKALFEPHRFAIVPSVGAIHQRPMGSGAAAGNLTLEARTKLEIMVLTGGEDPSVDPATTTAAGDVKDTAINWVLSGGAVYAMLDGLVQPGLKAWLAYATGTSTFGTLEGGGAQFVLEPSVATNLPINASKDLQFVGRLAGTLPLGGPLGSGNLAIPAGIASLRLTAGLAF